MKSVPEEPGTPFDSIEGAYQYVSLFSGALEEARNAIQQDADSGGRTKGAERRVEALRVVDYKLDQLGGHLAAMLRILNDLRTLRRLLLGERRQGATEPLDSA
jgi:hypothetical protein